MAWEIVKVPASSRGSNTPYASIGHGRLSLSVAACELIDDYDKFQYVNLMTDRINNKLCVGVQFVEEATTNSIKIGRKQQKGKKVGGVEISNRIVMENLFGLAASAKETTRYAVKKDDTLDNFLVIYTE